MGSLRGAKPVYHNIFLLSFKEEGETGGEVEVRKRLSLPAMSLVVAVLLAGGCNTQSTRPPEEEEETPEDMEGPRWFPESDKNFRRLTESEKGRVIEIALNTPEALKWREKESKYRTKVAWAAIIWENSRYSVWRSLDYGVVESGIPAHVSKESSFYPEVVIHFGEPAQWVFQVDIDLETERVLNIEEYPARRGIIAPEDEN